jgi:hypothetical protein
VDIDAIAQESYELGRRAQPAASQAPIDMILHCPKCGLQHVDAPEEPECCGKLVVGAEYMGSREMICCGEPERDEWDNPPHRSHLCHRCGHIWRPADVPTNGVAAIKTKGRADKLAASQAVPADKG